MSMCIVFVLHAHLALVPGFHVLLLSCLLCFSARHLGFRRLWLSTPLSHSRTNHVEFSMYLTCTFYKKRWSTTSITGASSTYAPGKRIFFQPRRRSRISEDHGCSAHPRRCGVRRLHAADRRRAWRCEPRVPGQHADAEEGARRPPPPPPADLCRDHALADSILR